MRIAIAGAGLMGFWHLRYARQCGATVCAIADRHPVARTRLGAKAPGAALFERVDQLLDAVRPDILHVCTPIESHAEIARLALGAGCHVLVEKPMAASATETEQLLIYARQHGLLIQPVHQFVFQRGFLRAEASMPAIGTPVQVEARFCSAGAEGRAAAKMDIVAGEILPHPLSLIIRLFDAAHAGCNWNVFRPVAGEWRLVAEHGGVTMSILVSLHSRPTECSLRLMGDRGTLCVNLFHGYSFLQSGRVSRRAKIWQPFALGMREIGAAALNLAQRSISREPAYPGLRALIGAMYRAVRSGSEAPFSAAEIMAVARARDGLMARARQRVVA